jgi:peptidyl-prolyl cis-trans isomerase D
MLEGMRAAHQSWIGRSLMAVLMGLIVVSFAIWGIGDIFRGFGAGRLARVGDVEISSEAYRTAYQNELQRLQRRARQAITNEQARAAGLDRQVLGRMVSEAALDQEARKLGLAMGDKDIARAIETDPSFRTPGGQFDRDRFNDAIREAGYTERSFVREQRNVYLRQEIIESLTAGVSAPAAFLEGVHRFQEESRTVETLLLPASGVGEIAAPAPDVLQKYFDDRKKNFHAPEYRKLAILAVTPATLAKADSVSDADARKLYEEVKAARYGSPETRHLQQIPFETPEAAADARAKIAAGTSFEDVAATRKLTPKDIDLGVLARSAVADPAVAAAAFALAEGEISQPIKGQFANSLVRVVKINPGQFKPYEQFAADLKRELAARQTGPEVKRLHDLIEDKRAAGQTLAEAARAAGLEPRLIDAVDAAGRDKTGALIADIPDMAAVLKAAFASDIGADNDTVTTKDGGYVWFEVAGIEPSRDRALDEVKAQVEKAWRDEEIGRQLSARAAEIVKAAQAGGALADAAKTYGGEVRVVSGVKRAGGGNLPMSVVAGVYNASVGGVGSAAAPGGRVVFRVTGTQTPPADLSSAAMKSAATTARGAIAEDLLNTYLGKLQSDLGVSVNETALRQASGGGNEF